MVTMDIKVALFDRPRVFSGTEDDGEERVSLDCSRRTNGFCSCHKPRITIRSQRRPFRDHAVDDRSNATVGISRMQRRNWKNTIWGSKNAMALQESMTFLTRPRPESSRTHVQPVLQRLLMRWAANQFLKAREGSNIKQPESDDDPLDVEKTRESSRKRARKSPKRNHCTVQRHVQKLW